MTGVIRDFRIDIPQAQLDDLAIRLRATRWPDPETGEGWSQGVPLEQLRALTDYWRDHYDWRRCEKWLNSLPQYRTEIDGLDIHFLHLRSSEPDARPLLLTHGWPGSILEFRKLIPALTDPVAHGGDAGDAFHLVIPSLPGFGFSAKPMGSGWGIERIARAWDQLMVQLGYHSYFAQGGDWGSSVTLALAMQAPPGLAGVHFNMLPIRPPRLTEHASAAEHAALDRRRRFTGREAAYFRLQASTPQTIGYALADSPVGQAAWIYEKLARWSDCDGVPETLFTRDEMLDNIMLYWLTNSAASSARLYWEEPGLLQPQEKIDVPAGYSDFPAEILPTPRPWMEALFSRLVHWNKLERGGHFAAWEQPALFVKELRDCFAKMG